jgi:hypothetical protein
MKWDIEISGKKDRKFEIKYHIGGNDITISGLQKIKNTTLTGWNIICAKTLNIDSLTIDNLKEILYEISKEMDEKLEIYNNVSKILSYVKEIEINNDL